MFKIITSQEFFIISYKNLIIIITEGIPRLMVLRDINDVFDLA